MVFGRPISVSDFVALNGKDVANSELEMWKVTVVTHPRHCSAICLKGMEKPNFFPKIFNFFATDLSLAFHSQCS